MLKKTALTLVGALSAAALVAGEGPSAKTASEYYLKFVTAMKSAKTIEDLRPFMDAEQQKQMDAAPKEEQAMGVSMISGMYEDITDIKVVKETTAGTVTTLELTAVQASDKQAGTGTAEIARDGKGWRVDSEVWKFGASTMTLKRKK